MAKRKSLKALVRAIKDQTPGSRDRKKSSSSPSLCKTGVASDPGVRQRRNADTHRVSRPSRSASHFSSSPSESEELRRPTLLSLTRSRVCGASLSRRPWEIFRGFSTLSFSHHHHHKPPHPREGAGKKFMSTDPSRFVFKKNVIPSSLHEKPSCLSSSSSLPGISNASPPPPALDAGHSGGRHGSCISDSRGGHGVLFCLPSPPASSSRNASLFSASELAQDRALSFSLSFRLPSSLLSIRSGEEILSQTSASSCRLPSSGQTVEATRSLPCPSCSTKSSAPSSHVFLPSVSSSLSSSLLAAALGLLSSPSPSPFSSFRPFLPSPLSTRRFYGGWVSGDTTNSHSAVHRGHSRQHRRAPLPQASFSSSRFKSADSLASSPAETQKTTIRSLSGNDAASFLREVALRKASFLSSTSPPGSSSASSLAFGDSSEGGETAAQADGKEGVAGVTRLSQALLQRCYADCCSLKATAIVSILESMLLLRECSSKLLVALAAEIRARLLKVLSGEQLVVILSAYSFTFPVSVLSPGFERTHRRPPETVEKMLEALCCEVARRLTPDGTTPKRLDRRNVEGHDGEEEPTDAQPHEDTQQRTPESFQERPVQKGQCSDFPSTHTVAVFAEASGVGQNISREGLVTAFSALARLNLRTPEAKNLIAALQRALCASFEAAAAETKSVGTPQRVPEERRGQQGEPAGEASIGALRVRRRGAFTRSAT